MRHPNTLFYLFFLLLSAVLSCIFREFVIISKKYFFCLYTYSMEAIPNTYFDSRTLFLTSLAEGKGRSMESRVSSDI